MDMFDTLMAKPKVLDLTKIICTESELTGASLSEVLTLLFQMSLQSSGSLATLEGVRVSPDNIQALATTNRGTYIIKQEALGSELRIPTTYMCGSQGAEQLAFSSMITVPNVGVVNMQAYIQFNNGATNRVNVGVKATVL